jgi:hypothetical protein
MTRRWALAVVALTTAGVIALAQGERFPSPAGTASTEIRGSYRAGPDSEYVGGKWIDVTYSRPIKRGRDLWGSGADYGRFLKAGAPVWRAGANMSTRLRTQLPLVINGKTVPAGEYSLFIDLKPDAWTLIVSRWAALKTEFSTNPNALWGAFGYTSDKDVVRAPMRLETLPHSFDQLTWSFLDMTNEGGTLAIEWDRTMASVPFRVGS